MNLKQPPYLGVAYYPEDWDESCIDTDIERMKEYGISVARIGEFAWHRMEPRPGEFDFSFFHRVIDKLKAADIAVVMGTPTATPPIWLSQLYPDVFRENEDGNRANHGGRRHCCSNNPHYNYYCMRIVEKMAQEFADEEAIIGWQIDNEIYEGGSGCFCPECRGAFHEFLRGKYGTVEQLDEAWNLNLFSQWYDSFEQIPQPRRAWHNPHLIADYRLFQNQSHIAFVHRQAAILKKYVKAPIGTDTMPFNAMDYREMNSVLDVVQFNHYNTQENLWQVALWFDFLRTLKPRPLWNTETATCWNGSTAITQSVKPEGFCRVNSWMPIALGGEANMYWLWRTHWAGHELMHGSVLDASGRPMHIVGEVARTSAELDKCAPFLNGTRVSTQIGMHFTSANWRMMEVQPVVSPLKYMEAVDNHFYKPLIDCGLRPDVIDAAQPLDGYRLIISPLMMTMDEHGLQQRMMDWVRAGGTWIVGPLSDVRNACGARYKDRPFGMLEELTGGKWLYGVPDIAGKMGAQWVDGDNPAAFNGNLWYELYEDAGADEVLARATAPHSSLDGRACLLKYSCGKGKVYVLGTLPGQEDMQRLIALAMADAGLDMPAKQGSVLAAPRSGEAGEGLILMEYAGADAAYELAEPMTDLLTGEVLCGKVDLAPYDVKVLVK